MRNLIDIVGRSFIVSSFIPATVFVALGGIIFQPIVPEPIRELIRSAPVPFNGVGILFIILSAFLGIALYSLNRVIYRMFEGYYLYWPRSLRKHKQKQAELHDRLNQLLELFEKASTDERRAEISDKIYDLHNRLGQEYPFSPDRVLATAFGNVFSAAEEYPARQYGIDPIIFWTRMLHVIPETYGHYVRESNNLLTFAVNSCILSAFLSLGCFMAAMYEVWLCYLSTHPNAVHPYYIVVEKQYYYNYSQHIGDYLILATFCLVLAWGLYKFSIPLARVFTATQRSCYDLFRFELIKSLRLKLPDPLTTESEWLFWRNLSDWMVAGKAIIKHPRFEYQLEGLELKEGEEKFLSEADICKLKRAAKGLVPTIAAGYGAYCFIRQLTHWQKRKVLQASRSNSAITCSS